jgi:hypothetical protein
VGTEGDDKSRAHWTLHACSGCESGLHARNRACHSDSDNLCDQRRTDDGSANTDSDYGARVTERARIFTSHRRPRRHQFDGLSTTARRVGDRRTASVRSARSA